MLSRTFRTRRLVVAAALTSGLAVAGSLQPAHAAANLTVSGVAVDATTGLPVSVTVVDGYSGSTARSDAAGRFSFVVQPGSHSFRFLYPADPTTMYYSPAAMTIDGSAIQIADDTDLGTVTLPSLTPIDLTVADEDGHAVNFAAIDGVRLDGTNWRDDAAQLTPRIAGASATWRAFGPMSSGVISTALPAMKASGLPAAAIAVTTASGSRYTADLADAVETKPGSFTVTISGLKVAPPPAPRNFYVPDNGQSTDVQWFPNFDSNGVRAARTGYTVMATPGGRTWFTSTEAESGLLNLAGIEPGVYTFQIRSESTAGPSEWSAPSPETAIRRVPGAPSMPVARVKKHKVVLTWTAPTLYLQYVTGYRVLGAPKKAKIAYSGTTAVLRDLKPGRYTFSVAALTLPDNGTPRPGRSVRVKIR